MTKIRQGFVSNSSSSSFLVIEKGLVKKLNLANSYEENNTFVYENLYGETEFGWETVGYRSIGDKINFCYIQINYSPEEKRKNMFEMLEKVIKNNSDVKYFDWTLGSKNEGYIDHESAAYEGVNLEMFRTIKHLTNFLFCEDSYIQGGNDNE